MSGAAAREPDGPGGSRQCIAQSLLRPHPSTAAVELKVVEREKNALKIVIESPDDTILYPLINELMKDGDVAEANYSVGHPQLDKPLLFVRTKKGKPQVAIKKAAESLAGQFHEVRQMLAKELK